MSGRWLIEPVPAEVARALARLAAAADVQEVAVMPDVHLAAEVCIGTVVATTHLLYPAAVGGDIGCGMAALGFTTEAAALTHGATAARVMEGLRRVIRVRRREGSASRQALPGDLETVELSPQLAAARRREGRAEFATLGSGNHFVELQADDEGRLWLMLHSGSRAFGQAVRAEALMATHGALRGLEEDSPAGRSYFDGVNLARRYAEASRQAMVERVATLLGELLGAEPLAGSQLACDHNHVRAELHGGRRLLVHRKGAIRAGQGEAGIIPGSMGSWSYHVEGRGCHAALCSSSHGAGRALSRAEARRVVSPAALGREMQGVWYDHRMAAQLVDEAPSAYKDIGAVMRAQHELTRITRRLRPLLSFKGG